MKIVYTTGCICDGLTVDNKNFDTMCRIEKERIVKDVLSHASEETLQDMLITFLELDGSYKTVGHCEQCGDTISEYSFVI